MLKYFPVIPTQNVVALGVILRINMQTLPLGRIRV